MTRLIVKLKRCPRCQGAGRQDVCPSCSGTGTVILNGRVTTCRRCRGQRFLGAVRGRFTCTVCNGDGFELLHHQRTGFRYDQLLTCPTPLPHCTATFRLEDNAMYVAKDTNRLLVECPLCLTDHYIEEVLK